MSPAPTIPATSSDLVREVRRRIFARLRSGVLFGPPEKGGSLPSAVMFLLGEMSAGGRGFDPCLILNKRSARVRQPGDLCCPGGGVNPPLDRLLALFLGLPGLPLGRWPHWRWLRSRRPREAERLRLLLAAGLREGFEEMGMNPLRVRFLGPLPPQRLVLFRRIIYPLAGFTPPGARFSPNWEVAKVISIPLRQLLAADNYARYRLEGSSGDGPPRDFPCFRHPQDGKMEILWGATYRITMSFLELAFGFVPPPDADRPVLKGALGRNYRKRRPLSAGR